MSEIYLQKAPVRSNEEIAKDIYSLKIESPEIARSNIPGQFINIQTNPGGNPIWRRPFSVARIHNNTIEIIYKAIGTGTNQMAALNPGDVSDIIGPLGNTFSLELNQNITPLLIGGGLGFAPLIILRDYFVRNGRHPVLFMGALNKSEHYYTEDTEAELHLASDDGSLGQPGFVTDILSEFLQTHADGIFQAFSCGPEPMMKAVAQICRDHAIPLELSIEREMACGIGLCQGCAIQQKPPHKKYALVCKDGPIFNADHLVFTE